MLEWVIDLATVCQIGAYPILMSGNSIRNIRIGLSSELFDTSCRTPSISGPTFSLDCPVVKSGQRVGYVRVSSFEQSAERQLDGVELCRIFTDKASGKDT